MSLTGPDVLAALEDFITRIDVFDPGAPSQGELAVRLGGREARLSLRAPVARALVEALAQYHDPRDRGSCDHCGGRSLDEHFLCRDCGAASGVFGQLLAERAAGYAAPEEILPGPAQGRHVRED